jgi:hypothetical protein
MSLQPSAILAEANVTITGAREEEYGDKIVSFTRIANFWSEILGVDVLPHQVALCMASLKISRAAGSPTHHDSWVDLAGYAAIGATLAVHEDETKKTEPE